MQNVERKSIAQSLVESIFVSSEFAGRLSGLRLDHEDESDYGMSQAAQRPFAQKNAENFPTTREWFSGKNFPKKIQNKIIEKSREILE